MKHTKILEILFLAASLPFFLSCSDSTSGWSPDSNLLANTNEAPVMAPRDVARMFAALDLRDEHIREVHDAVSSSSGEGYDEEYMLRTVFDSPGAGTGGATKASAYSSPLRDLIIAYLSSSGGTKAGSDTAGLQRRIDALTESGMQIYWPYSEEWDGVTEPIVTYDPGNGAETGYAFVPGTADSVLVDESIAAARPVWVINTNSDCSYEPVFKPGRVAGRDSTGTASVNRNLMLKSFKMLRNYDTWFGGASEFWIRCGSVEGFTASTEAELSLYYPTVTEFPVVVKRRDKGVELELNSIVLTDFTNQLDKLAFLMSEDDGGTRTSWKCSATVKIKSKSYGFDVSLPFNEKDDIVWRGQLAASFFQGEDEVTGRFGDVVVTFALE